MNDIYQKKGIIADETTITDIDEKQGKVIGYFSKFGNVDSDSEMIMPGAFKKTLSENYKRVKHLYQHDSFRPLSATNKGNLIVKEDRTGLAFESTISQTSWGKDALQLHIDGVIDENSIGFRTVKSNKRDGYKELTELQLWEGSAVTWAANEFALTSEVKSLFTPEMVVKRMDTVMKAIRNGKYENEELFDQLDLYFKQLSQILIDLTKNTTEPVSATQPEKADDLREQLKNINQLFKAN